MLVRHLFGVVVLCASAVSVACEPDSLPIRYLQTITMMDWHAQHSMLAKEARYHDPTMIYFDRPAIDIEGADGVVEFWRSASEDSGTTNIDYEIQSCFETAGYYVIDYAIRVDVSGKFWNVNQPEITLPGQVSSIIRVRGNEIIEHIDYVDYAGTERWIDELRRQVGAWPKADH